MKNLDFDFFYAKFGLLWNKNASFSLFFGDYLLLLYHQIKKIMDLLHVIAVVALVIIGVFIYVNKKNG